MEIIIGIIKTWCHILIGCGVLLWAFVATAMFVRWFRGIEWENDDIRNRRKN